jgi:hypothetical protein
MAILFNRLVRESEQFRQHFKAERLCGFRLMMSSKFVGWLPPKPAAIDCIGRVAGA